MHLISSIISLVALLSISAMANTKKPPFHKAGTEKELAGYKMSEWQEFAYYGKRGIFDGGSIIYSFKTKGDISFSIFAANELYMDEKKKDQIFYLFHKEKYHLISSEGKLEKQLLMMLVKFTNQADNSGWFDSDEVKHLIQIIKNRKLSFAKPPINKKEAQPIETQ